MEQLKTETRSFWDTNPCGSSTSWDKARFLRYRYTDPYLLPVLDSDVFDQRTVLEVGCGQGFDASLIAPKCGRYVGMDISPHSLTVAREAVRVRVPDRVDTLFVNGDAENLCFSDGSFDLVYSVGVLHHTPSIGAAFDEIDRVLRPGGKLILMLYRSYTPLWFVLRTVRGFLRVPGIGPAVRRRLLESSRRTMRGDDSTSGTVVQELVGCPIIDTFTLEKVKRLLRDRLTVTHSECHRVGFEQVIRILPKALVRWWPQRYFDRLESSLGRWLGFYLFLTAEKPV